MKHLIVLTFIALFSFACQPKLQEDFLSSKNLEKNKKQKIQKGEKDLSTLIKFDMNANRFPYIPRSVIVDMNDVSTLQATNVHVPTIEKEMAKAKTIQDITNLVASYRKVYKGNVAQVYGEQVVLTCALRLILKEDEIPASLLPTLDEYYQTMQNAQSKEVAIMAQTLYLLKGYYSNEQTKAGLDYLNKELQLSSEDMKEQKRLLDLSTEKGSGFGMQIHKLNYDNLEEDIAQAKKVVAVL